MTTSGMPTGFEPFPIDSAYAQALGPLAVDRDRARLGLFTTDALANIGGVVHGGALVTLADIALFVIAARGGLLADAVTLTLNTSFVAPARLGRFIVAEGRVVRDGRSIIFVDGQIIDTGDNQTRLTFAGTLKRIKAPSQPATPRAAAALNSANPRG